MNNSATKRLMFKALLFFIFLIDLGHSKLFIFIFKNRKYFEVIFAENFILQEIMKKKILKTSDAWSTCHLSQQTSKPACYIVDCWIFSAEAGAAAHVCMKLLLLIYKAKCIQLCPTNKVI